MTVLIQTIWIINELFASVEVYSIRKISSTIWIRKLEPQLLPGQTQSCRGLLFPELTASTQTELPWSPKAVTKCHSKTSRILRHRAKYMVSKLLSNAKRRWHFCHGNTAAAEPQVRCQLCTWVLHTSVPVRYWALCVPFLWKFASLLHRQLLLLPSSAALPFETETNIQILLCLGIAMRETTPFTKQVSTRDSGKETEVTS